MARSRPLPILATLALAALLAAGCEVEWGGARVGLETPERAEPVDTAAAEPETPDLPPLPEGPLLHVVRIREGGRALALPAARMTARGPVALDLPADPPDPWWDRFDDSLRAPGTEVPLYATGRRIGTLVLGEVRGPAEAGCPAPSDGRILLPPGAEAPELAFAWTPTPGATAPSPEPRARPTSSRRLRLFGPILAERLLQEAGVDRSFLARRAALEPVAFPGDTAPGMAATYLIGDTLAPVPPTSDEASSLFFLARYDPSEGYVPVWSRAASYADTADKLVLSHVDWLPAPEGRVEVLRRTDARSVRLAAARVGGEDASGELDWTASSRCPVLEPLGVAGP